VTLGDLVLEREDEGRFRRAVRLAAQREQLGDVGLILGADLGEARVVLQVVFALRQVDAALRNVDDVAVGVAVIEADAGAERAVQRHVGRGDQLGDFDVILQRRNACEIRLDRRETRALDRVGVHIGAVVVADLLLDGTGRGGLAREFLDDRAHFTVRLVAQHVERSPARAVSRDLGVLEPRAVHVPEEVVARLHGEIARREVEAVLAKHGLAGRLRQRLADEALEGGRSNGPGARAEEGASVHGLYLPLVIL